MVQAKPVAGQSALTSFFARINKYQFACAALTIVALGLGAAPARAAMGPGPEASPWIQDASASLHLPTCAPAVFDASAAPQGNCATFTTSFANAAEVRATLALAAPSPITAEASQLAPAAASPILALLSVTPGESGTSVWGVTEVVNLHVLLAPEATAAAPFIDLLPQDASTSFFVTSTPMFALGSVNFLAPPRREHGEVSGHTAS